MYTLKDIHIYIYIYIHIYIYTYITLFLTHLFMLQAARAGARSPFGSPGVAEAMGAAHAILVEEKSAYIYIFIYIYRYI